MGRLDLRDKQRDEDESADSSVTSEALGTDVRPLTETAVAPLPEEPCTPDCRECCEAGCCLIDTEYRAREILHSKEILDACCGGRMWWWDKSHPLAVYMDKRREPRGAVGESTGRPEWNPNWSCEPDIVGDFRSMPFDSDKFQLVVFDPPHVKAPLNGSITHLKYGALHPDTEQDDLARGFAECWRVLAPGGTLVFKWAGPLKRVEPHFPATPIVGTRSPRGGQTRWIIFYKSLVAEIAA